jgi:hypothetical protein
MKRIKQFPHCDARVLHAPGVCEFCDAHQDWQELRKVWGIAFTGQKELRDEKGDILTPCPAEVARPLSVINKWPGNIPETEETKKARNDFFDRLAVELKDEEELEEKPPARVTLSGKPPDPNYDGPAPQPIGPLGMHLDYWVLSDADRAKGFVRPVRHSYKHVVCNKTTSMNNKIAETYARDPKFYNATFCATCGTHYPLRNSSGKAQFLWLDGEEVGN